MDKKILQKKSLLLLQKIKFIMGKKYIRSQKKFIMDKKKSED